MKYIDICGVRSSAVALGLMRLDSLSEEQAAAHLAAAFRGGINFFDHADIYGGGECERLFSKAMKRTGIRRDDIVIQTKCGIVPGVCYDFSKEHILSAVEGSLKRLGTDRVDFLLLHRPDALMEPEEVGEAFRKLKADGKVLHFGVSNFNIAQIELLESGLDEKLAVDQVQFGPAFTGLIDCGLHVNMKDAHSVVRDGNLLDNARKRGLTLQAWSPFQYGFFEGAFINSPKYEKLNETIARIAEEKNSTPEGITAAWILRHPANIQMIAGTMNGKRLSDIIAGADIMLGRREWYEIYVSAGNPLP